MQSVKEKILDSAMEAVGEREFTHGECVENNKNIADLWTAYLGVPLTADEVASNMHVELSGHEDGLFGYWKIQVALSV